MSTFHEFAAMVAHRHDPHLLDEGPDEQAARIAQRLAAFHATTPLAPAGDTVIDLAGFGTAPMRFVTADDGGYVLLSDVADALGWALHTAHAWADNEYEYALRDQRHADEARGDGRLGYEYMRGVVDLGVWMSIANPEAKPDGLGKRWSTAGDWLVSRDRLPALLLCSPWGHEFANNTMPHWAHTMRKVYGEELRGVAAYNSEGQVIGNAHDDLFRSDLSAEEALRRARRGPALDPEEGQL
ncbi:hypothetical protein GCM10023347_33650 [Streptomyces chumphonensis]|uniref:Uncharacterized protein n=1 Tax=Streptomyces chumphonensis TaxID=1214925 RepID=A0A927ID63_9ACTN|nr:hypothetical protein [Streptomyces chumphonensis]MBD3931966.1 hypothetical protein [Streptomyces chumphonensis]